VSPSGKRAADPLALFHPAVAGWFRDTFPHGPTEAQQLAWPRIAAGESVLLISPTGTGKTLAAFLVALNGLLQEKLQGREAGLRVLYISPLKALDNDVHRNLEAPREGIARRLYEETGASVAITASVRTGDTKASVRAAQVKRPPDILITTPETLYLMLTSGSRRIFGGVGTVILDEVHSVAGVKRGTHLALTLERLEDAIASAGAPPPARIALSATVQPPERIAAFVGGARKVTPLVVRAHKAMELEVVSPAAQFAGKLEQGSAWGPALDAVAEVVARHRTTLVFCNNRRHAERLAARLEEKLAAEVPTHHGSIARAVREDVELRLKGGALRAVVATGSLELGLDVGPIEAVVQVGSPKGVARALQRVGRSGHLVGETSRGRLVPLFLEELYESAALVEAMRERDVEETHPPEGPLDVLAQQLVAETVARATAGEVTSADGLFATFRRADPYRKLPRRLFDKTLAMLSGKYPKERFAELAAKLVWDRATGRVSPLPAARLSAILDGGTIGDRGVFKAVLGDGKTVVGELDEEFVYELRVGEAFLLGSRAWRAREISHDRVVVEDATGAPAKLPFWRGESEGRTPRLGERVGRLKRTVAERLGDPDLPRLLQERYGCNETASAALIAAVTREANDPGGLATEKRIVFETFPNDLGDPCLLVRSVFGRAVHLPWSLALASLLREETGLEIEGVSTDDGILLRAPRAERELPMARLMSLSSAEARERLLLELPNSPLFGARFRENAQRALLLPRRRPGRRTPFWLQRLKARDLLMATRSLPDFPIVAETYRDCLKDLWQYDRLLSLLDDLQEGRLEKALDVRKSPSPAAQGLLFGFVASYIYEWDAPKAEKGLHALAMNRELLGEVLGEDVQEALRPEAVEEARAFASRLAPRRLARTADELLLVFGELGDLTAAEVAERSGAGGEGWLRDLLERGSVVERTIGGEPRFVPAEELERWTALAADAGAQDAALSRFVGTRGPATAAELAARYALPPAAVEASLARLQEELLVVRGRFGGPAGAVRWAGARLAESIRRRSIAVLRREISPVPLEVYRGFLAARHGVVPGTRHTGPDSAERAVALLRGLPLPALSWETAILPVRLLDPEPDALDALSSRGLLVWRAQGVKDPKAARLSFFFRGEGQLFLPQAVPDLSGLSDEARRLYEALAVSGASFLQDVHPGNGAERALLELVLAGLVTGDGLHGLRELLRGRALKADAPGDEEEPRSARQARALGVKPERAALRAAEERVARRLGLDARGHRGGPSPAGVSGRFSILASRGVTGEPLPPGEREETWARLLLSRWGVVRRETLELEDGAAVRWSDVAPVFARLEMRGELRRGEFVAGGGPVQYAEEETVERLRRRREGAEREAIAAVSGADPVAIALQPPAQRDELVALSAGAVVCRLEPGGALSTAGEVGDETLRAALAEMQLLKRRGRDPLARPRRLLIESVDGAPMVGSRLGPLLEALGFTRERDGYAWRAL